MLVAKMRKKDFALKILADAKRQLHQHDGANPYCQWNACYL